VPVTDVSFEGWKKSLSLWKPIQYLNIEANEVITGSLMQEVCFPFCQTGWGFNPGAI